MSKLKWDQIGERIYETGLDHGVLYPVTKSGTYDKGVAWNGLSAVNESPSGAEANPCLGGQHQVSEPDLR